MSTTLSLGTQVTFSHPLYRLHHASYPHSRKTWEPHPYWADDNKAREGIVVGKRTLANGRLRFEEYGAEFDREETFSAYLIAFDLHRKPVYVRPEHVTPQMAEVLK